MADKRALDEPLNDAELDELEVFLAEREEAVLGEEAPGGAGAGSGAPREPAAGAQGEDG